MPTVVCPSCGKKVTFEGVAGVCPNCASVVRPPQAGPDIKSMKPAPRPLSKQAVRISDIASIADADDGDAAEVFEPGSLPSAGDGQIDKGVLYTMIGAAVVVLLFTLYAIFSSSSSSNAPSPRPPPVIAQGPPPPPAPTPAAAPQPGETLTVVPTTRATLTAGPAWAHLKPIRATVLPVGGVSDDAVGKSLARGVDWMMSQYFDGVVVANDPDNAFGIDALATYALLHAGTAINDPRIGVASPFMSAALERLKQFDLNQTTHATYSRSLRASALALFDRPQDRSTLAADLQWLVKAASRGSYSYTMPPKGQKPEDAPWDNSNSQYGVLGVWAAAQAGHTVTLDYWHDVQSHWLSTQFPDGSWSYNNGLASSITMTCAGITTLSVAAEQQSLVSSGRHEHVPISEALNRGISWLSNGNIVLTASGSGYALYGMERAALATGIKRFGAHDWYRELAAAEIGNQNGDGSWAGDRNLQIETAFRILFLARGRQALAVNKLRFDGDWNNRPRDASKLAEFAALQLEQPFAWGVADLARDWNEWIDCPFMLITTDTPPQWGDEEFAKLRKYTDAGGMIFLHAEQQSPEMDAFAATFAQKAYPDLPFTDVGENDYVYSVVFPLKNKPPLKSVNDGVRTLFIYSPTDVTRGWVTRRGKETNEQAQLGLNLFVYAAGKNNFRGRLMTPYLPPPSFAPLGSIPIARVQYSGKWDPAPGAWLRFPRWFQNETSLGITVQPASLAELSYPAVPVAVISGSDAVDFGAMDLRPLHDFVNAGGVVLIDAVGGSKAFVKSVREQLLPKAFGDGQIQPLDSSHPILAGTGEGMDPLPKAQLRQYALEQLQHTAPPLDLVTLGKGAVVISDIDLTNGLLEAHTWGILGYEPSYANSLVKNLLLWASQRYHP